MYISIVTLYVNDIDRAAGFYTDKLGWEKTMDVSMGEDGRWVTIAPKGERTSFTLTTHDMSGAGRKAGGFTGVIIEVDDVFKTHADLQQKGVTFAETPRTEPWGGWAMFTDSEGNVLGLHSPPQGKE